MNILYVGRYSEGSTSRMRGEYLKKILRPENFVILNTDIPIQSTSRVFRSLGWRYKIGPLIQHINLYTQKGISQYKHFDLAWIDKGVFIQPEVINQIRNKCTTLVHFTPDPAFTYHQSKLFFQAIPYYDHCITTKSFEIADYKAYNARSIIFCTQGYDPQIHRPYHNFEDKLGVVFIGHKEQDREEIISLIIENRIPFKLAGIHWEKLAFRYRNYANFQYFGKGVFGKEYAKLISSSKIGLGFLSKIIPEKHTTRTFEIPACGTLLATQKTEEIEAIFQPNEALFFEDAPDLVEKVSFACANDQYLSTLTENGFLNVVQGNYNYESILSKILQQMNLL